MSYIYKNIKKTYFGRKVVDIDNLVFESGKIYGIKGFNGSGKSTLCKILAKIEEPDSKIEYPNITVGYMPQMPYAFDMSVINNVLLNYTKDNKNEIALTLLSQFDLDKYKNVNAKTLSGGEKQKLSLARLMINRYDMLILDEPTSSMDYDSTIKTDDLIKDYVNKNNSTIIMVSHEEEELKRMTDNIIRLDNGIIKS